jgi:hypothetical protein
MEIRILPTSRPQVHCSEGKLFRTIVCWTEWSGYAGSDTYVLGCNRSWWRTSVPPLRSLIRARSTENAISELFVNSKRFTKVLMFFKVVKKCPRSYDQTLRTHKRFLSRTLEVCHVYDEWENCAEDKSAWMRLIQHLAACDLPNPIGGRRTRASGSINSLLLVSCEMMPG